MRIQQSICYPLFLPEGGDLEVLAREAAATGYKALELWAVPPEIDEIVAIAKRNGLVIASMNGHASLEDGLNKRSNHDRIEAELIRNIDLAAKHDIPGLICLTGNRQPFVSELEAIEAVADGLRRVAPYAEQKGVNLNLELLNSKVDHSGYQCDHTAWGLAVCERVNSPRVKLLFDIYHMQIMEGDVISTIRDNIKLIGHFHTAGVPGRFDLDDEQELNYRGICKAIAATGYDLYFGHEFKPKGDPITAMKAAYEVCNQS